MSKIGENGDLEVGNTKPPPKSNRVNQSKYWCFTFNNFKESDRQDIINHFDKIGANYIIGIEKGELNNILHLQGYVEVKSKMRWSQFKLSNKIHWEPRKGSQEDNIKYCSKDKNFVIKGLKIKRPLDILLESQLYTWQSDIVEQVKQIADKRTINWIFDRKGNMGKTEFGKYLAVNHNAIPLEGKKNDILYCAAQFDADIYYWDLERSMEDYVSYASIEKIKGGIYMCAKYESQPIKRNCPHIYIFANFPPDMTKLSLDRWMIYNLKKWTSGATLASCCVFNGKEYKPEETEFDEDDALFEHYTKFKDKKKEIIKKDNKAMKLSFQ